MQHTKFIICSLILYISEKTTATSDSETNASRNCQSHLLKGSTALDNYPLVDGHNDLPYTLATTIRNQLKNLDLTKNLSEYADFSCDTCSHTDLPKLRTGKVGAVFWAAYVSCESQYKNAVTLTLEQIDVIKRLVHKYSKDFQFVTTANGVIDAFKKKKIASLIGVEGGHSMEYTLSVLRSFYQLGVRYMTLTHMCNTPWADASPMDTNSMYNLTDFGKKVVLEMNRLGMMVDLSHVSYTVMNEVLKVTKAPVMFSHSSVHAIHAHHRNVRDDVLRKLKINKGVIMINFYSEFVGDHNSTITTVIDHINHAVDICGIGCVGIGSDFNGVSRLPQGLENVSKYPNLFNLLKELNPTRWSIPNLEKLAGRNIIRVFKAVERVRDSLRDLDPIEDWIPEADLDTVNNEVIKQCIIIPSKKDTK